MWKDDFYASVCDFINKRYGLNAVEVTDVYDQAYGYDNSMGGSEVDYTCDIGYMTADGKSNSVTYNGRFSSLIEDIT
jgi:hypothetical protein